MCSGGILYMLKSGYLKKSLKMCYLGNNAFANIFSFLHMWEQCDQYMWLITDTACFPL